MALPSSDRRLRRLVAELAGTSPEDVQAVLSGLEESQRERVEALLTEYQAEPRLSAPAPAAGSKTLAPVIGGLSPWLSDRLAKAALDVAGDDDATQIWARHDLAFSMTPTAVAALHEATLALRAEMRPEVHGGTGGGWFARLRDAVARTRPS